MLINQQLDEGLLLDQQELAIESQDTTPSLTEKLIDLSSQMLATDLPEYLEGRLKPYAQPSDGISYSRKLVKEDGLVDWQKPAEVLEREVRAYAGWPKSRAKILARKLLFCGPESPKICKIVS